MKKTILIFLCSITANQASRPENPKLIDRRKNDLFYITMKKTILIFLYSITVHAAPEGFELISGQASFPQTDVQGQIHIQSTQDSVVHWNSFSLHPEEVLIFNQAQETSSILNRVIGSSPSEILGRLQSNGIVYLINQNGILIGPNGIIETAGFLASTLDILTQDFFTKNTVELFSKNPGSIINLGTISCPTGQITLLARSIDNQGEINGTVQALACTKAVLQIDNQRVFIQTDQELDASGGGQDLHISLQKNPYAHAIKHSGRIKANTFSMQNGRVYLFAQEGTTDITGDIEASNIDLLGKEVLLRDKAHINASADIQGGNILIGGSYKGQDANIPIAEHVLIENQVQIRADAVQTGDGGEVIIWSEKNTEYLGSLSAKGGVIAGNGGFVEISGKQRLKFAGSVDLTSTNGKTGHLLIDPDNITITPFGTDPATGQTFSTTGSVNISGFDIGIALNTANLTLQANQNIIIQDNIADATAGNGLILQAGGSITNIGTVTITLDNGNFSATFNDQGATNTGGFASFTADNLTINTSGGNISIQQGNLDNFLNGTIILNNSVLNSGTGAVQLNIHPNNDTASIGISLSNTAIIAGETTLHGVGVIEGVSLIDSTINDSAGITINGTAGNGIGIVLDNTAITAGGAMLNGTGTQGGVSLANSATINSSAGITVNGIAQDSGAGIDLNNIAALTASNGNIVLNGQGPNSNEVGISLSNTALVNAVNGSVTLNATLGSIDLSDAEVFCGGPEGLTVNSQADCILSANTLPTQMLVTSGIADCSIGRDLTLASGTTAIANAIIGTGSANLSGGSLQFNVGRNVNVASLSAQNYSLIGYGSPTTLSNVSGNITFNHVGGDVLVEGANSSAGGAGFAQIGHLSGDSGANTLNGNIYMLADGSISVIGGNASPSSYAQIGNGGSAPFTTDGQLTAIAGKNIIMQTNTGPANIVNSGGNVTLVTDNLFPAAPGIGPGFFSINARSNLLASGEMRIYTALRSQNQINGLINGSSFTPGTLFVDGNEEMWAVYYPGGSYGGFAFKIYYKDGVIEAIEDTFQFAVDSAELSDLLPLVDPPIYQADLNYFSLIELTHFDPYRRVLRYRMDRKNLTR